MTSTTTKQHCYLTRKFEAESKVKNRIEMHIKYDDRFVDKFLNVLKFIAQDSTQHAEKFEQEIKEKISNISDINKESKHEEKALEYLY
jgi:hypothetical protein